MSPGSSTESYPAFAHIGLRENPGKNLNQVTCLNRESNPGHLVSRPDSLTVTPQTQLSQPYKGADFDTMFCNLNFVLTDKEEYAVNMLGENPQTIGENTGILLEASKEVNTEKTKYMIMSRDENIVRNGNIKIGNLSFEEMEKFKYLGATVTNINDTREEIKHRINMGNACYYSVEKVLSSSLLSKNLKVRIYKTVILPVVLYGCESWTFTLREEHSDNKTKLQRAHNLCVRFVSNVRKYDHITPSLEEIGPSQSDISTLPTITVKSSNRSGRASVIISSSYESNLELSLTRISKKKKKKKKQQEGGLHVTKIVGKTKGVTKKKSQRKRPLENSYQAALMTKTTMRTRMTLLWLLIFFQYSQKTMPSMYRILSLSIVERMFLCPTCVKKQNK
ncbi:hypothetical protein ANN_11773 [Periplaneta americana]|uniref:Uncharacterized protein n=1 Tax=Periplaneta americana TaxID=6978 RepID=A0ABQ8T601_PERAM|nr:hypothetical protein ANN_11773 [Periplaneta americana]